MQWASGSSTATGSCAELPVDSTFSIMGILGVDEVKLQSDVKINFTIVFNWDWTRLSPMKAVGTGDSWMHPLPLCHYGLVTFTQLVLYMSLVA